MSKTSKQLDAEIRAAVKRGQGDISTETAERCNTCGRPKASPFRRHVAGKIVEGCVDAAHTGHVYGESLRWHMRPVAKEIRKRATERLRGLLG